MISQIIKIGVAYLCCWFELYKDFKCVHR